MVDHVCCAITLLFLTQNKQTDVMAANLKYIPMILLRSHWFTCITTQASPLLPPTIFLRVELGDTVDGQDVTLDDAMLKFFSPHLLAAEMIISYLRYIFNYFFFFFSSFFLFFVLNSLVR